MMESVKFSRGDRPWWRGEVQVELYSMRVVEGKIVWSARALGGVSSRRVLQSDLTEEAPPDGVCWDDSD